ncbi:hypothetical protein PF008_g12158 [Phytophthora fragariae]|uniref:Secreted protein n=1 Tax=Phytophthora fragariae TaxID=53985 RepID=A0A6G0RNS7_9STRA|nr:hypothetical protein PF008_g12158 [Phytophthora fragariae]
MVSLGLFALKQVIVVLKATPPSDGDGKLFKTIRTILITRVLSRGCSIHSDSSARQQPSTSRITTFVLSVAHEHRAVVK